MNILRSRHRVPWRPTSTLPSARIAILAIAALNVVTGCAGALPPGFDPRQASLTIDPTLPTLKVDRSSSAAKGTRVGTMTGLGSGAVASLPLCSAAGPFAPLCIIAVIATGTGLGAATGAAAGGSLKENQGALDAKAALLDERVGNRPLTQILSQYLRALADQSGVDLPVVGTPEQPDAKTAADVAASVPWLVEVAVMEITTDGKERFQFEIRARLRIRRAVSGEVVLEHFYDEVGDAQRTLADWSADDGAATTVEINALLRAVAAQMLDDLRPSGVPVPARAPR